MHVHKHTNTSTGQHADPHACLHTDTNYYILYVSECSYKLETIT